MKKSRLVVFSFLIALAIITFAGCDIDPDNPFEYFSSWKMDDGSQLIFKKTSWEWTDNRTFDEYKRAFDFKGTYAFAGNTARMNATHFRYQNGEWEGFDLVTYPDYYKWFAEIDGNKIYVNYYEPTSPSVGYRSSYTK